MPEWSREQIHPPSLHTHILQGTCSERQWQGGSQSIESVGGNLFSCCSHSSEQPVLYLDANPTTVQVGNPRRRDDLT